MEDFQVELLPADLQTEARALRQENQDRLERTAAAHQQNQHHQQHTVQAHLNHIMMMGNANPIGIGVADVPSRPLPALFRSRFECMWC